jgi:hypothetical protein
LICVVDASVVLKWFLPEPDSAAADFLLEKFLNDEVELLAPDLMLVEAASALWKLAMVRKERSANEAALIDRDLLHPIPFLASLRGGGRRRFSGGAEIHIRSMMPSTVRSPSSTGAIS